MLRFFDFLFSFFGLVFLFPLLIIIYVSILLTRTPPIFKQKRLGKNQIPFFLYKFRTMNINTLSKPTHMVSPNQVTKLGVILRKTKLDELPQLYNVLLGNMSLVGPRPCLPDQKKLINFRRRYKIFSVRPGITGLAQIKSIDMSLPELLAKTEKEMIKTFSVNNYFYYIFMTILGKGRGDRVKL